MIISLNITYCRLEILYGNFNHLLVLPWNKKKGGVLLGSSDSQLFLICFCVYFP